MPTNAKSNGRPSRLVYGVAVVFLTLLISVVLIKHFAAEPDQSKQATAGPENTNNHLNHSGATNTAAATASSDGRAASAATEPPNPFKALPENAHPSSATTQPPAANGGAASLAAEQIDPFKAYLDNHKNPPATATPAPQNPPDAQNAEEPGRDPFKEFMERRQGGS